MIEPVDNKRESIVSWILLFSVAIVAIVLGVA